jgi:hypothetical protein
MKAQKKKQDWDLRFGRFFRASCYQIAKASFNVAMSALLFQIGVFLFSKGQ